MDINDKVAARRAELVREQQEQRARARAAEEERREALAVAAKRRRAEEEARSAAARKERERMLDEAAAGLSTEGARVARDGEELELPSLELDTLDPEAMKDRALRRLLSREARRSWTAAENWIVIGCVAGGAAFALQEPFGLVIVALGAWAGVMAQKGHRRKLVEKYPHLFARIAETPPPTPKPEPATGEPTFWQTLWWNPHARK